MNEHIISSFYYMILKLATKYVENEFPDSISKTDREKIVIFNTKNNFGKTKVNLFPFLITIANGKKDELLTFFEKRFAVLYEFGVVQQDVHLFLNTQTPVASPISFNIADANINLDYAKNLPEQEPILLFSADGSINHAFFQDVPAAILTAIEYSISFVNRRVINFANLPVFTLSLWSKRSSVYNQFRKFKETETQPIEKEKIIKFREQFQKNLSFEVSTHELSPHA